MTENSFEIAVMQTLKNEGVLNGKTGYVNSKNDSGGETNFGITVAKARECGYKGKMCDLPYETAKQIYYNEYWKKSNAGNIPSFNISFLLFDFAVNSGVSNACKKLQTALNKYNRFAELKIDGIIGQKTLKELKNIAMKGDVSEFYKLQNLYITEILSYYTSIKNPNTGFAKNGAGWVNRVVKNIHFLMGV